MKRILCFALSCVLALSLAACGGGTDTPDPAPAPDPAPGSDAPAAPVTPAPADPAAPAAPAAPADPAAGYDAAAEWQEQVDNLNKNNLTPEQVAQIEAEAKADGYEVQWAGDGSIVVVEGDSTISTSGGWPDNEFTELVPAPGAGTPSATEVTDADCTVMMTWTAEEAKAYAAALKEAGFTENADEQDMADMGVYYYMAAKDGVQVSVTLAGGVGGINIVK